MHFDRDRYIKFKYGAEYYLGEVFNVKELYAYFRTPTEDSPFYYQWYVRDDREARYWRGVPAAFQVVFEYAGHRWFWAAATAPAWEWVLNFGIAEEKSLADSVQYLHAFRAGAWGFFGEFYPEVESLIGYSLQEKPYFYIPWAKTREKQRNRETEGQMDRKTTEQIEEGKNQPEVGQKFAQVTACIDRFHGYMMQR